MKNNQNQLKRIKRRKGFLDNFQLFTLSIPTLVLLAIFSYWPMFGIVLAFKSYKASRGIWGSPWIGLKNFEFFFTSQDMWRVLRNTLGLNFMFIFANIICAVIFALLMFEVKKAIHVKAYQSVALLPSFLSWVAVSYLTYALLEPSKGIINKVIEAVGGEGVSWYSKPEYWPIILLIVELWKGVGYASIIYYAALMGIDGSLFDAANVDGASKLQTIWYVTLPELIPIITIRFIMSVGGIFRSDFGLFYNVTRNLGSLYPTTDVIDTYVYRALMENNNIGMSSAVGLFQSTVCLIMLLTVNAIVRKVNPENSLF